MEYLGTEAMVELDSADTVEVRRMKEANEADTVRLGWRSEMFERQESSASTLSNQSWCESPETCHTWDMQSVVTTEFYFSHFIHLLKIIFPEGLG